MDHGQLRRGGVEQSVDERLLAQLPLDWQRRGKLRRRSESTSTNLRGLGAHGGEVRGHAEYEVFDFDKVVGADAGRLIHQEHNVGLASATAWNSNS